MFLSHSRHSPGSGPLHALCPTHLMCLSMASWLFPPHPLLCFLLSFVSCAHGSRWQDGFFQDAEPGCPGVPLGNGADPLRREPGREQPQCPLHSTPILTRRVSISCCTGLAVGGVQCDNCSWCTVPQENEMCGEKGITLNIYTHYHRSAGRPAIFC